MSGVPGTYKNGKGDLKRIPGTRIPSPENFPGGTVGIVAGDLARYSEFTVSLCGAISASPKGSKLRYTRSVDVSGNCNEICRAAISDTHHDWVWIMGDDHGFDQSTLLWLLEDLYSSDDVDVVVPHCLKRTPPWMPVVYSHQNDAGWFVVADLPQKGLTRIHAAGSAGMLIRRRVLETLDDPWFQPAPGAAGLNEDLYFCEKVREAGFGIFCDPEVTIGHIAAHTIRPTWNGAEGGWQVGFVFDEDHIFAVPSAVKTALEQDARQPSGVT